jgi:hypothetical protein
MPHILDAVRAYATEGEIMGAMVDVFGLCTEQAIIQMPGSHELRLAPPESLMAPTYDYLDRGGPLPGRAKPPFRQSPGGLS